MIVKGIVSAVYKDKKQVSVILPEYDNMTTKPLQVYGDADFSVNEFVSVIVFNNDFNDGLVIPKVTGADPYPVGSVYVGSTDTNPSELFGGKWQLFDEEFKPLSSSSRMEGFYPDDDIMTVSDWGEVTRTGHEVRFKFTFNTTIISIPNYYVLGYVEFTLYGISAIKNPIKCVGISTNGNSILFLELDTEGVLRITGGVASDPNTLLNEIFYVEISIVSTSHYMDNSFCNKFYWKRTE